MRLTLVALFSVALLCMVFANPLSANNASTAAKVGASAPDFALMDQSGKEVKLSDYKGKIVVLEWFNEGCPYVKKFYSAGHMNKWAAAYGEKSVVWLTVNSTSGKSVDDNKKISESLKIERPLLSDASGAVGKSYGAKTTPHMYVVNKDGVLAYAGAIDNKSTTNTGDIDGAKNYVAQAVDELLAGKSVSEPETQAYGCGVKYAK